ncbi:MAG: MOP flippase family protein [Chitinispirillaceae bacterium]|nr:MOP flippase family protein [Chitinispirillaceae bacterium]
MKLKGRIISDTANVSMAASVTAGTQLLETIILARILVPEEMGLVAVIAVIIGFVRSVADLGVSNALIHFQNTSRRVFSSLFWVLAVFGAVIFCAFFFGRPVVSHFLPESPLIRLSGWIGLIFLVSPPAFMYQFFLQKEMRFRRVGFVEGAARCLGTVTVFSCAVNQGGVFSYVAGQIVYSGTKSALLMLLSFRLMPLCFSLKMSSLLPYLRFGMFQMGERVVSFFASNVDYIIIGKLLGVRELGFYKIAYELVTVPQRLVTPIFNTVTLPRFAKNQHDDAVLREGILRVLRILSLVTFPLLLGLAASVQVFVPAVYGSGWEPAVPLLWLLTVMALCKTVGSIGGTVIITKGHVKAGFIWNCIIASCNTVTFLAVARGGAWTVAAAYSFLSLVYLLSSYRSYFVSTIGLPLRSFTRSFMLPLLISAVMGTAVFGLHCALGRADMGPLAELAVLVLSGAATYVLLIILLIGKETAGLFQGIIGTGKT